MTTSRPTSTRRLARSSAISATRTWELTGSSKVDEMTSASTERSMSVTSSGRSPIKATIKCTCGYFSEMALAICFRTVVLPALGGETIIPPWPFPLGAGMHDAQDQILFLEPRRALDLEIAGDAAQIGQVHGFQLSDIHGFSRESGALGKASDSGRAARMTNEQVSRRQGLDVRLNSPGDEPGTAVRYGRIF